MKNLNAGSLFVILGMSGLDRSEFQTESHRWCSCGVCMVQTGKLMITLSYGPLFHLENKTRGSAECMLL